MLRRLSEPCIPTRGTKVPSGRDGIHEIKHDGYRLLLQRDGKRVRLFTRNGHDWTDLYPLIVGAALKNRSSSFVIDGEAVLLGVDGVSDFDGLHARKHDGEIQLHAFDCLALDGDDLRKLPLSLRKTNLARLLARRPGQGDPDYVARNAGRQARQLPEFSRHRECSVRGMARRQHFHGYAEVQECYESFIARPLRANEKRPV